jgi:hypothetical protein
VNRGCLIVAALALVACVALILVVFSLVESPPELSDRERMTKLLALPYLSHSPEKADEDDAGVVRHVRAKAYPGYNLYTSRTSPEIHLIDMEGNLVQSWTSPQERETIVEYAALFGDGDLLVINKFEDVVRIDSEGEPIWRREIPAHHDLWIEPDDSAYVVARDVRRHNGLDVDFSALVLLGADGGVERRWDGYDKLDSIRRSFDMTPFDPTVDAGGAWTLTRRFFASTVSRLRGATEKLRDPFHLNTVTVLPDTELGKRDARFRAGNLLICYRNLDQIAIFDPENEDFVWSWGYGALDRPHYPVMLDTGRILVFDNGTFREWSRVIELDPETEEIVWEYVADPRESFYSEAGGSAQRLPNGNTLITETMKGRVFEITAAGEIVWEWYHPVIDEGHRSQVYRMIRYPAERVQRLLP